VNVSARGRAGIGKDFGYLTFAFILLLIVPVLTVGLETILSSSRGWLEAPA